MLDTLDADSTEFFSQLTEGFPNCNKVTRLVRCLNLLFNK